jgi:hypothetical protein
MGLTQRGNHPNRICNSIDVQYILCLFVSEHRRIFFIWVVDEHNYNILTL